MPALFNKAFAVNIGEEFKIKGNTGIKNAGPAYQSIGDFISAILPNIYIIAGIIVFFLFIGGGFMLITSGDNPDQKGNGAKAVTAAVVGFIIIFVSYWIVQIVEILTGIDIFQSGV